MPLQLEPTTPSEPDQLYSRYNALLTPEATPPPPCDLLATTFITARSIVPKQASYAVTVPRLKHEVSLAELQGSNLTPLNSSRLPDARSYS